MYTESIVRLNSLTKYPSILTYHQLGERGKLIDHVQVPFDDDEDVIITEKIDGTNTRIILIDGGIWIEELDSTDEVDYFIGSREELLHAKGDRIWVPVHDIVKTVKTTVEGLLEVKDSVCVIFGEVYGGSAGTPKNYTGKKTSDFRVFDVMLMDIGEAKEMLTEPQWTKDRIASWRQHGGQTYCEETIIQDVAMIRGLATTPRLGTIKGKDLPKTHKDTLAWLQRTSPKTLCKLDDGAKAKSEGVVVRNNTRTKIAKIRFEDYERTLRPEPTPGKKGKR